MSKNDEIKNFGSYLRQLRLKVRPKKITQGKIGEILGATRQYIDRVEKQKGNTTPPKLEYLLKILEVLKATPQERYTFLWLAFKDRIHTNWDLYRILHTSSPLENKRVPSEPSAIARPIDAVVEDCWYKVQWVLSTNSGDFNEKNVTEIHKLCEKAITEMDIELRELVITKNALEATLSIPTHLTVGDCINGLKVMTSRAIRNSFPTLNSNAQTIWESGYGIRSVIGIELNESTEPVIEKKLVIG